MPVAVGEESGMEEVPPDPGGDAFTGKFLQVPRVIARLVETSLFTVLCFCFALLRCVGRTSQCLRREPRRIQGLLHKSQRLRRDLRPFQSLLHASPYLRRDLRPLQGLLHASPYLRRDLRPLQGLLHASPYLRRDLRPLQGLLHASPYLRRDLRPLQGLLHASPYLRRDLRPLQGLLHASPYLRRNPRPFQALLHALPYLRRHLRGRRGSRDISSEVFAFAHRALRHFFFLAHFLNYDRTCTKQVEKISELEQVKCGAT